MNVSISSIVVYYDYTAATGVTLSQTEAAMTVGGETLTLTATVAPDNASFKTVTWTTSDAGVATVADGVVTAVAAGTATITATVTNGTPDDTSDDKTATCTVTVSPVDVTGVTLSQTEASMIVGGETLTLTPTVAPDNASFKTVTWTTSDANVATVADGVVTAVAAGTATITATATNGTPDDTSDDKTATCTVTVSSVDVTGVTLSQTEASMIVGGETLTLTPTVAPDNASFKTVTWTTSDANVATVTDGVVTAVAAGTATITATVTNGTPDDTSDDKTATCTVTVVQTYNVTLKEGTEDATNWTIEPNPAEKDQTVTITYNGSKRVKSVKAVKKAATITVTWTEGDMSELYVPFHGVYAENNTIKGITVTAVEGGMGEWNGTNIYGESGTLIFSSSVGNIKSIVISAGNAECSSSPTGWTVDDDIPATLSWSGNPSNTVEMPIVSTLTVGNISSIVFTIEPTN